MPIKIFQNNKWKQHYKENTKPMASVLVPFYNNLKFLKLVIAGLMRQTNKNFEIIICDDGSNEETIKDLVPYLENLELPLQYVWHEDLGFRKNRILNQGLLLAKSEFVIFIDADCVVHSEFVAEYIAHAEPKTVLSGRRVELSPSITNWLTEEKVSSGWLENNFWWISLILLPIKDSNSPKGYYFRSRLLRKLLNKKSRPIVGSSFAGNKIDFFDINGFDLRYEGVGIGEDSDIDYRLQLNGVKIKPMTNIAVQYHMWHPYKPRPNSNEALFQQVQASRQAVAPMGLRELGQGFN
jgi:glycosyltransferase involved in cell wall biosynthesis